LNCQYHLRWHRRGILGAIATAAYENGAAVPAAGLDQRSHAFVHIELIDLSLELAVRRPPRAAWPGGTAERLAESARLTWVRHLRDFLELLIRIAAPLRSEV